MLPDVIGAYKIGAKIGEGRVGTVFAGVHQMLSRPVAIKVISAEYTHDAASVTRILNDVRAISLVDHPGLVQVFDCGQLADGTAYVVMELLQGESLTQRLLRGGGRLPLDAALYIGWQLADSLRATHDKNITHRDLKPRNITLVPDRSMPRRERTKLLDVGIGKLDRMETTKETAHLASPAETWSYGSPEHCTDALQVDARSDVYSLGCILYHMLSGSPPYVADNGTQLLELILAQDPKPLATLCPWVPAPMVALVHEMLNKDRDQRPLMKQVSRRIKQQLGSSLLSSTDDISHHPSSPGYSFKSTPTGWRQDLYTNPTARRGVWMALIVLLLSTVTLAAVLIFTWQRSAPASAPAPLEARVARLPARKVALHLSSEPPGALVIRSLDGTRLGQTPWDVEQEPQRDKLEVYLRIPGDVDPSRNAINPAPLGATPICRCPVASRHAEDEDALPRSCYYDSDKLSLELDQNNYQQVTLLPCKPAAL